MAAPQKKHVRTKYLLIKEDIIGKDLGARWPRLLTGEVTGKEHGEAGRWKFK